MPMKDATPLRANDLRLLAAGLLSVAPEVTYFVGQIVAQYREFAAGYYPTGRNSEYANIVRATRTLAECSGWYVEQFGPRALRELMERLAAEGKARAYVNGIAARIKRMFKWAAAQELIDVRFYQALATVPGLRSRANKKRTGAEWADVLPVGPIKQAMHAHERTSRSHGRFGLREGAFQLLHVPVAVRLCPGVVRVDCESHGARSHLSSPGVRGDWRNRTAWASDGLSVRRFPSPRKGPGHRHAGRTD